MWTLCKVRQMYAPMVRCAHGYPGGIPGLNMPFRRGMASPLRFTIFWTILGVLGYGSPWIVVSHQMLRNTYGSG